MLLPVVHVVSHTASLSSYQGCSGLIDRGNLRDNSVTIGKDRKVSKNFACLFGNAGCIPLAVVMMTTANGMHPTFSGKHPKIFIISDLYRVVTKFDEMHTDNARIC